jgi:hypothetical protein
MLTWLKIFDDFCRASFRLFRLMLGPSLLFDFVSRTFPPFLSLAALPGMTSFRALGLHDRPGCPAAHFTADCVKLLAFPFLSLLKK